MSSSPVIWLPATIRKRVFDEAQRAKAETHGGASMIGGLVQNKMPLTPDDMEIESAAVDDFLKGVTHVVNEYRSAVRDAIDVAPVDPDMAGHFGGRQAMLKHYQDAFGEGYGLVCVKTLEGIAESCSDEDTASALTGIVSAIRESGFASGEDAETHSGVKPC